MPGKVDPPIRPAADPALQRAEARRQLGQIRMKYVVYSMLVGAAAGGIITLTVFWLLT
jgi:hypothetical protein